jgi:hypothetical protein
LPYIVSKNLLLLGDNLAAKAHGEILKVLVSWNKYTMFLKDPKKERLSITETRGK